MGSPVFIGERQFLICDCTFCCDLLYLCRGQILRLSHLLPAFQRIAVFFINAADFNGFGRGIQCHFQLYRGGRGLQLRKMVQILFCGHYGKLGVCRIAESRRADFSIQRTGKLQSLVTGLIQQAQGVVNRLGDSVLRHHTKAAVKFLSGKDAVPQKYH